MKTLYIDCGMGAAGDMLTAALIDLFDDPQSIVEELNQLGIPDVEFILEECEKCGIYGKHMKVLVNGEEEGAVLHHHHHGDGHHHNHDHHHHHEDG
ncbi:MAG: DUF111 family protein, partial [Erysipelotrichaceae bacterium]|nr:DUF111 family protein [Erysipelotrichaceae bacterium]